MVKNGCNLGELHVTAGPVSTSSLIEWLSECTLITLTSAIFITMADTQQKINRVVVDLIKGISPPPHVAPKYQAYFSNDFILVHLSVCCKNAGGINSRAIKTFKRRVWKRKVSALLQNLNEAEIFNQVACLLRWIRCFYELSLLPSLKIMSECVGEYESNWSDASQASPQHTRFKLI